jgi:N-methylhydantoinase B
MTTDLLYEQPAKLIRDLTDDEFEQRYDCERFTASVLGSRYRYIVQHMCTGLLNNAFSVILRDCTTSPRRSPARPSTSTRCRRSRTRSCCSSAR